MNEPLGFRDVYWCYLLNEPVIITYHFEDGVEKPWCIHCQGEMVHGDGIHVFICHINKPVLE